MHEYTIVSALIGEVDRHARAHGASAVQRLVVRLGAVSGVEPELLAKAYSMLREKTVCAGAELCLEQVEERWVCPGCGRQRGRGGGWLSCERCGIPARLEAGDEIILERIEMEVA